MESRTCTDLDVLSRDSLSKEVIFNLRHEGKKEPARQKQKSEDSWERK